MALNKLENQIKEKLDSREIQPSAQAWDRLDAMLSVTEEKKTRRPFGFLFIAASITVLLTVGMYFFTQNGSGIQPKEDVVTTETKDTVQKQVNEIPIPIVEQKQVIVSNETQLEPHELQRTGEAKANRAELNPKSPTTNNNQRVSINNQKSAIKNQQSSNQNPIIQSEKEIQYQNSSDVALKNLPVIETKKETVGSNKSIPTDEQLLASLDKTAKQSTEKKAVVKVNPNSLLTQVDGELELTFREKVINKAVKNYKEVKVALANRNNE